MHMQRLVGTAVLVVAIAVLTSCGTDSGAAGVRARLDGYPDLGWSDSKMDRFGARICVQFPNGPFADPRVHGTEDAPAYAAYVGDPKPRWITWMAPGIWQDFYDAYCPNT